MRCYWRLKTSLVADFKRVDGEEEVEEGSNHML